SRNRAPTVLIVALVIAALALPRNALAQACCAGSSAATPGRLAQHEKALVGILARGATMLGSFGDNGHYASSPKGVSEYDFEEDAFGALRLTQRSQVALLVPLV